MVFPAVALPFRLPVSSVPAGGQVADRPSGGGLGVPPCQVIRWAPSVDVAGVRGFPCTVPYTVGEPESSPDPGYVERRNWRSPLPGVLSQSPLSGGVLSGPEYARGRTQRGGPKMRL